MSTAMSTAAPEAPALPFEFFDVLVVRTRRVSPSMMRVTLGGDRLRDFTSGGRDQRFKLFLPQPGQDAPVVPSDAGAEWFPQWRKMDPAVRGIMRSYTVREQRRAAGELDIDFALHGTGMHGSGMHGTEPVADGPASRWAAGAQPGDRAVLLGPVVKDNAGVDFRPPAGTDWVLISGDETALPAVAGILEWLPAGMPARVWIEVGHAEDVQSLPTEADAEIHWLVREDLLQADPGTGDAVQQLSRTALAPDAVRATSFPPGTPYAWVAGEASTVRALRRHLVKERGIDRKAVTFTGYWRLGATEEQLVEEAVSETGPDTES
ncbi:siderophore-interacting protein [Streptomyces sp. N2-109]|uniref:Siderophore-interacting protein n=1 Tax=Streptomyces gossypii TaxID=2883101 RepID=A0ABT2JNN7_9ACTN|nr:siderophore-interacting protein [Streptomyces gossypii]MCT2588985.1 siderophore-interacting protein [Streptomyces gossypii]